MFLPLLQLICHQQEGTVLGKVADSFKFTNYYNNYDDLSPHTTPHISQRTHTHTSTPPTHPHTAMKFS